MTHLVNYNAPPSEKRFRPADLNELREIQRDIEESEKSALATEWSQSAWTTDIQGVSLAIAQAESGRDVLIAQDEDGYYFAVAASIAAGGQKVKISFSITHNISSSKGWGRYSARTQSGLLVQSSTGNEWVSAPHSGETAEGAEIVAVLQTMERVGKRREENISTESYRLVAATGQRAELGYWNGLQVIVENARIA